MFSRKSLSPDTSQFLLILGPGRSWDSVPCSFDFEVTTRVFPSGSLVSVSRLVGRKKHLGNTINTDTNQGKPLPPDSQGSRATLHQSNLHQYRYSEPGSDRRHSPLAQRCLSHISSFHGCWPQRIPCGSTPEDGSSISLLGSTDNANIHDLSALRLFLHRKWWRSSPLASCAGDRGSLDARRQFRHVLVTTFGGKEHC